MDSKLNFLELLSSGNFSLDFLQLFLWWRDIKFVMLIVFLTGLQCSQVTKSLLRLMQDIEVSLLVKKVN